MFAKHIGKRISHSIFGRLVKSNYYNVVNNGLQIPASLRQLLYPGDQPAYYTEEEFPDHSHLLKDYSSGVGSLRPKRLGYCYDFDGVNDFVITDRRVTTGSVTALTVCGWVKFTGTDSYPLVGEYSPASNQRGWLLLHSALDPGKLTYLFSSNGTGTFTRKHGNTTINDGVWHHIAAVQNGADFNLYVDGSLETLTTFAADAGSSIFNTTAPLRIGFDDSASYSPASKYDFRVYEQVLTADEITYLYTNGLSGTDPGTANLVAHYPLQEESGTVAYDISGNENHGTITNAVTSGVGSIHQPDAGVTKSYPNDAGYKTLMRFDGVGNGLITSPTFTLANNQPFQLKLKTIIPDITSYERIFESVGFSFTLMKGSSGGHLSLILAGTAHNFSVNTVAEVISLEVRYTGTNLIVLDNDVEVLNVVRTYTGATASTFRIGWGGGTYWKGFIFDVELYIDGVLNRAYSGAETTVWTDTSGNSRNGTVAGSPELVYIPAATPTLDALGSSLTETGEVPRYGTALGYGWQGNGSNVYFSLGSFQLPIGSHTFSFWYYNTSGTTSHRIMDTRVGSALYLITANAGVEKRCQFAGKNSAVVVQDNIFTNNTWHFIEITQTGTAITCDITPENGTTKTLSSTVVTDDLTASPIYFLGGFNSGGSPSISNASPGIVGPITITAGGVTTSFHPIPGTRDVAKVVSNGQGSVIFGTVVNGVLADLYTIGDDSWRLPHIENGANWASQNLVEYSEDLSKASWVKRNGCTITQIASEGPSGQTTVSRVQLPTNPSTYVDCYQDQTGFTSNADVGISFWLKNNGSVATSANFSNRSSSSNGQWLIDLTALSAGWNFITASHPAVTVVYSTKVGPAEQLYYGFFIGTNEPSLDVLVSEVQINYGTEPLPYEKTGATARLASALIPAGPGQANAVNGNAINIPANVAPRGLLTDRTGGVIAPLDYVMGTDEATSETYTDVPSASTVEKRIANESYADRYGAALTDISAETYFSTGQIYHPFALDYFARAEGLGGSFDLSSINATYTEDYIKASISAFVEGCMRDAIWEKLTEVYLLSGVTFGGLMAKLKHAGTATLTNTNFVSGDLLAAGSGAGLKGNGSNKFLTCNFLDSSLDADSKSFGAYQTSIGTPSDFKPVMGIRTASAYCAIITASPFTAMSYYVGGPSQDGVLTHTGGNVNSFMIASRRGINDIECYVNGTSIGVDTTTAAGVNAAASWEIFRRGSSFLAYSTCRVSFAFIGSGLSDTDASNLSSRVNSLMTSLGANVY